MRRGFVLASLVALIGLAGTGCGGYGTSPSAAVPTVSGSWDITLTGTTSVTQPGLLTLTETAGVVTGTFRISSDSGPLSGTISQAGEMGLGGRESTLGYDVLFRVTADASRRSFTGTFTVIAGTAQANGSVTGTKR